MWMPATMIPFLVALAGSVPRAHPAAGEEDLVLQAEELGGVRWKRDLGAALGEAEHAARPVLLLVQQVPGSDAARAFGRDALAHPLLVEAIETWFVPLALVPGATPEGDEALQRYGEAQVPRAESRPRVRFLDAAGSDLLPRRPATESAHELAVQLLDALGALGVEEPPYLRLVAEESAPSALATATLAAADAASLEARVGVLDGVLRTRAGQSAGRPIVQVDFRPDQLSLRELIERSVADDPDALVYVHDDAQLLAAREVVGARAKREPARVRELELGEGRLRLGRSPLRFLPLTDLQATRVNAALGTGGDPFVWLSPRQRRLARHMLALMGDDEDLAAGLERPLGIAALEECERRWMELVEQRAERTSAQ